MTARGLRVATGEPGEIYRAARRRGMDLVTLTDTDTIDGCLDFLNRNPDTTDFMISEEVIVREPRTGAALQLLLFDITEQQHREVGRLRSDLRELLTWLAGQGIPAALSPRFGDDLLARIERGRAGEILGLFGLIELRNGSFGAPHRALLGRLVRENFSGRSFGVIGGSGSHGPARVGSTATVSFARTREEFLADLRAHRTWDAGADGSPLTTMGDMARTLVGGYRDILSGRAVGGWTIRRRALAGALAALPLHLSGATLLTCGIRSARYDARVRHARRRLDRIDVETFQSKARMYAPVVMATDSQSGEAAP